jgi:hypothetical protein
VHTSVILSEGVVGEADGNAVEGPLPFNRMIVPISGISYDALM